jgi:hypothetical protein
VLRIGLFIATLQLSDNVIGIIPLALNSDGGVFDVDDQPLEERGKWISTHCNQ